MKEAKLSHLGPMLLVDAPPVCDGFAAQYLLRESMSLCEVRTGQRFSRLGLARAAFETCVSKLANASQHSEAREAAARVLREAYLVLQYEDLADAVLGILVLNTTDEVLGANRGVVGRDAG